MERESALGKAAGFYSALVGALGGRRNTLPFKDAVWVWEKNNPYYEEEGGKWRKIRELLEEMRDAGLVVLQKDGAFRIASVSFPSALRFPALAKKPKDIAWVDDYAWHPSLEAYCGDFSPQVLDDARTISEWLKNNDASGILPLRERSYEIFNDEKYLDKWKGGLFGKIMAPLSLIGAYWPPVPLACEKGVPGQPLLIVENHHTFASFVRWNAVFGKWSGVVWGRGCGVENMRDSILAAARSCDTDSVEYFGDIDPAGINIMSAVIGQCSGHIDALPFLNGYELALDHGKGNDLSPTAYGETEMWILDKYLPELRLRIIALWDKGLRIPQEALNFRLLDECFSHRKAIGRSLRNV